MDRQLRGHTQLRSFLLDAILKILQKSLILTLYQAQPASRMIIKKREEVDLMLSLDHLSQIITQLLANNGWMVYGGLFLIILAETGLVVTPFLPGDSLLFLCGSIAAMSSHPLNIWYLLILVAASRVYLRAHYPSDILGSLLLAGFCWPTGHFLINKWALKRQKEANEA